MGNAQSSPNIGNDCPSPFCRALCLRNTPPINDDGEWFGELPRENKKRKSRKSRRASQISTMPAVPEESEAHGDTTCTTFSSASTQTHSASTEDSLPSRSSMSSINSLGISLPSPVASEVMNVKQLKSTRKFQRSPKVKLTYVNGQFVDLSTEEGQIIKGAIRGIETSVYAGHTGLIPPPLSKSSSSVSTPISPSLGKTLLTTSSASHCTHKMRTSFSSFGRTRSDASTASVASVDSASTNSSDGSSSQAKHQAKDTITSMVALGDGYLLTASRYDRVIKMWKVEDGERSKCNVEFVRDFVGHTTGITCITKVDNKGRFLSASKDRSVKLWDSRYNCDDEDQSQRVLLSTFERMDRRALECVVMVHCGSYFRPTDDVDWAMLAAVSKRAMKEGPSGVSRAAKDKHIIDCSCEFAAISGKHRDVRVWSMKNVDNQSQGGNVAEVILVQELDHETTVDSVASLPGKGMILTGDRMGHLRLWRCRTNVFLPGSPRVYSCERSFSWRLKSDLCSVNECMSFAVTSLAFISDDLVVSGTRGGVLRVWNVEGTKTDGETVHKEVVNILGAHSSDITSIQKGCDMEDVKSGETRLTFSSASNDGKVLSFVVPVESQIRPVCFNVVNHGITDRYRIDAEGTSVTALACLDMPGDTKSKCLPSRLVVSASAPGGNINILKSPVSSSSEQQQDALVLYRNQIEEESLTLHVVAQNLVSSVESRHRKYLMKTYKDCFVCSEAVTYLVEKGYALTRQDAVDLGRVLATHLLLFEHVSKKDKLFEDSKELYRFSDEYANSMTSKLRRNRISTR
jgi:WD40 repeat protein